MGLKNVTTRQRRNRLATTHRLLPAHRVASVAEVADSVVALHSSDPVSVYLSLLARLGDPTPGDIEHALYKERTVVRHHAMRRTLWVTTPAVAEVVHAACTRKIAAAERRRTVKSLGGDEPWLDGAIERIVELLREEGPLLAREVGKRLPELERIVVLGAGTKHPTGASGHTRALQLAGFEGRVMRGAPAGTWVGSQYAWAHRDNWVDVAWDRHDTPTATAQLVSWWLQCFGPGSLTDLVWWTGTTKGAVRSALGSLDVVEVDLGDASHDEPGFLLSGDEAALEDPGPWVALLPGLDPLAMGWKQRRWYLDEATEASVTDRWGNIGPTVWVDGEIVGGWAQRPDGSIATELTQPMSAAHRTLLANEVDRLMSFSGEMRYRVRFPAPNQARLLSS